MAATSCTNPTTPTAPPTTLRVLIIDAHPAVGRSLVRLVGIMPGLQTRGLALCGADGVERAGLDQPDVVLVDAELPHEAAPATIRRLRRCLPSARIVALGLYPDRRAAMLAAGAHAFVLKDAGFEALRAAITAGAASDRGLADRGCSDHDRSDRALSQPDLAGRPSSDHHPSNRSDRIGTAESESASARTPGSVL
jgi:DNA-binding NarL/FixJ family response regulator